MLLLQHYILLLVGLFHQAEKLLFLFTVISLLNPLSANFTKWSNTLKQFVGNLPTNCLSVFDHFVGLSLKGLSVPALIRLHLSLKNLFCRIPFCLLTSSASFCFFVQLTLGTSIVKPIHPRSICLNVSSMWF